MVSELVAADGEIFAYVERQYREKGLTLIVKFMELFFYGIYGKH